jgi:hypothetical protein
MSCRNFHFDDCFDDCFDELLDKEPELSIVNSRDARKMAAGSMVFQAAATPGGSSRWSGTSLGKRKIRALVWQIVLVVLACGTVALIVLHTAEKLKVRSLLAGFSYLGRAAGFEIPGGPFSFSPDSACPTPLFLAHETCRVHCWGWVGLLKRKENSLVLQLLEPGCGKLEQLSWLVAGMLPFAKWFEDS